MDERISQLLTLAVAAPSGDNCQPWRFSFADGQLNVYNLPQKDTSLYNHAQWAALIAHGALLENLAIAAPSLGLRVEIRVFPDPDNSDQVSSVVLAEGERFDDPLLYWIERRCTNRKKYVDIPLTEYQKQKMLRATSGVSGVRFHLTSEPTGIQSLAAILANNDRLVFENRHLHQFLFEQIRWTDEESKRTRDGMDIRTLELPPVDELVFRIFRSWSVVGILNKVGLSKIIAQNGKKLVGSSAGIAALTLDGLSAESFVRAGRAMQRFWLQATELGLSVQPVAGLALLIQRVRSGASEGLSDHQRQLIMTVAEQLDGLFGLAGRPVVLMFRIGTSSPPSARSLRMPVVVE